MKHLLTIAGSDSSGGAGIQADLKAFAAHGVFGMSVITAVTAQNTCGVTAVQDITPEIITAQIDAVFSDIRVDAVKIGMVSRQESIHAIAEALKKWKPPVVVVDPVMISKSGYPLLQPEACDALIKELLPCATLLTPNLPEAESICGFSIRTEEDMEKAAASGLHYRFGSKGRTGKRRTPRRRTGRRLSLRRQKRNLVARRTDSDRTYPRNRLHPVQRISIQPGQGHGPDGSRYGSQSLRDHRYQAWHCVRARARSCASLCRDVEECRVKTGMPLILHINSLPFFHFKN